MPLGLMPRVRTQDQGWPFQDVHHCSTHILVTSREKIVRIYTDLTTKLNKDYLRKMAHVAGRTGEAPDRETISKYQKYRRGAENGAFARSAACGGWARGFMLAFSMRSGFMPPLVKGRSKSYPQVRTRIRKRCGKIFLQIIAKEEEYKRATITERF